MALLDASSPRGLRHARQPRGLRHAFGALRHRDFALFWSGALVSNVGGWMQQATVPFVLFQMTGSAAWIGLAAFLQFLPMMAMNAVGGVLADRFDRKRLLIATNAGLMALTFLLFALWEAGQVRPGVLVSVVAAMGLVAGIMQPTWHSFLPLLVPRERLLNAVALNSAQFNSARAVGPALAGLVLAVWGPGAAFLANALSFLVVLAALAGVRATQAAPEGDSGGFRGDFGAAVRYVRGHAAISLAIALVALTSLIGAPMVQFTAVFARDVFGVGEVAYGLLAAGFGAGAVAGAVVVSGYGAHVRRSRLAVTGVLAIGAGALGLGVAPGYGFGLVAVTVMGAASLVVVSALSTSIQLAVRDDMRGRVMAVFMMSFTGAFPVGALIQGRLADTFGVQATVAVAGAILVGVALVLFVRRGVMLPLDAAQASDGEAAADAASEAVAGPPPAAEPAIA